MPNHPSESRPAPRPATYPATRPATRRARHRIPEAPNTVLRWYRHALGLLFGLIITVITAGKLNSSDWGSLWIAGLLVRDGNREHLYNIDERDFALPQGEVWFETIAASDVSSFPHPFVHVPFVADVMSLVVRIMSFDTSVLLLTVASGWALVVLLASAWFFWFTEEIPMVVLLAGILLGWVSAAFQSSLYLGQTSPLIFAGVAYGLAAVQVHPVRAGLALGVVASIKLTPVIVVVICLFFPRARKAGLVAMAVGMVTVAYSIVIAGWDVFMTWRQTLQEINAAALVAPVNGAFASQISTHLVDDDSLLVPIINDPPLVTSLVPRLLTIALVAVVVYAAWRSHEPWKIATVGIFTTLTATSGILWDHYTLIALMPLLGVVARGQGRIIYTAPLLAFFAFPPLAASDSDLWFPWSALIILVGAVIALCVAELQRDEPKPERRRWRPSLQ